MAFLLANAGAIQAAIQGASFMRGSFTINGRVGTNTFKFRGRIGGKTLKTLKPGSYRLNGQAADKAKNKSRVKRIRFRVVKLRR